MLLDPRKNAAEAHFQVRSGGGIAAIAAREESDDQDDPRAREQQAALRFLPRFLLQRVDPADDQFQVLRVEPEMAGEFAISPAHRLKGEERVISWQGAELLFRFAKDILADQQVDNIRAAGVFVSMAAT